VLYDPAVPSTFGNKITYYNPVNGLSNFFTLFERRTSSTGRANLTSGSYTDPYTGKVYPSAGGVLTFVYPMFDVAGRCRKAWADAVDRFSGSNYFNPYHMHAGNQAGYPHLTSLWIELRDNRGNLVDIAGGNRTGAAVSGAGVSQAPTVGPAAHNEVRYFKGGFHGIIYRAGTITNGSTTITGISSTASLLNGMRVSGNGIPSGATIASVDSGTEITLSVAATASGVRSISFQFALTGTGAYSTVGAVDTTDTTRTEINSGSNVFPMISTDNFPATKVAAGTRTSGSPTITALPAGFPTTYLRVGEAITGSGIPANTTIVSIDSATQITMSQNATSSGTSTYQFSNENFADLICDTAAANTPYMVSMERAPTFGDGTNPNSWQHATKNMTDSGGNGGKGIYIKPDYRDRTIATPGEINSRWSALP
jgi:hypothetical protein